MPQFKKANHPARDAVMAKEATMKNNTKARLLFRLWLILYQLETCLWDRFSSSFMTFNEGKHFWQYHSNEPYDDIPF